MKGFLAVSKVSPREELLELLAPVAATAGLDLEDLEVTPAGKRRVVRVIVDKDGGVSLDDIATVSTAVAAVLDEPAATDVLGGSSYVLEVTSPGVDRALTEARHWRRAVGRLVKVSVTGGGEVEGRVVSASADAVVLDLSGTTRSIALAELGRGRVQVEFSRPDGSQQSAATTDDEED